MNRVSLCIIAKNEAKNLEACIAPLRGLVHEILVVDTGSTDETRQIAERVGARVIEFPWCDDFSAARNQWALHATGDFILWLDADDRVPASEVAKLRELFGSLDPKLAYLLSCVCLTIDGGVGCEVDQVRLYRNRPEHRWQYRVHEQITPGLFATGTTLKRAGIHVVHTGYVDAAALDRKCERNFRLVELDCADGATDPLPLYNRAVMLLEAERFDEALVALHLCQPFIPRESPAAPRACGLIVTALRAKGEINDALEEVREGRVRYPFDRDLPYLEAQLLVELGELASALGVLLEFVPGHVDVTLHDVRMRTLYGELSLRLGSPENAYDAARVVTTQRPSYGPAWLLLADAAVALGKTSDLGAIETKLRRSAGAGIAALLVRVAGDRERAEEILRGVDDREPFVRQVRARLRCASSLPFLSCLSPPWTTERTNDLPRSPRVFWQTASG